MITIYRILSLTVVLGIIVLVHELGHYIAARLMKVRVEVFSFGFGKRLFGKKVGDTDIRVSLIPLGGYVKMAGEDDYEAGDPKPDEFQAKNRAQKIFILFMGPAMNFLLAFFIVALVSMGGVQVEKYRSEAPVIGYVEKGTPAEKAGIQKGDLILTVAGESIEDWQDLELTVGSNPNEDLPVTFERDGVEMDTTMRVGVLTRENLNPAGFYWALKTRVVTVDEGRPAETGGLKPEDIILAVNGVPATFFDVRDAIAGSEGKPLVFRVRRGEEVLDLEVTPQRFDDRVAIGIGMYSYAPTVEARFGPLAAVKRSFKEMVRMTGLTINAFKKLFAGKIPASQLSGPIDIAKVSHDAMRSGMSNFFVLIAFLSLHIGLINLFPIPVLDGGHLMIYSIESLIRRDFSPRVKTILMNLGFILVVAIMVFAIFNDIQKNLPEGWRSLLPF